MPDCMDARLSRPIISRSRGIPAQALLLVFGGLSALCAQSGASAVMLDVPTIKQPYDLCLAAWASMVVKYWGVDATPQYFMDRVTVYKDGVTGQDLQRVIENIGFRGFLVQPPFEDLLEHLSKGRPPIVQFPSRGKSRHAMVLAGFDADKHYLFLIDPANGKKRSFNYKTFRQEWDKAQR